MKTEPRCQRVQGPAHGTRLAAIVGGNHGPQDLAHIAITQVVGLVPHDSDLRRRCERTRVRWLSPFPKGRRSKPSATPRLQSPPARALPRCPPACDRFRAAFAMGGYRVRGARQGSTLHGSMPCSHWRRNGRWNAYIRWRCTWKKLPKRCHALQAAKPRPPKHSHTTRSRRRRKRERARCHGS